MHLSELTNNSKDRQLQECLIPVSYTHLDVYKRQLLNESGSLYTQAEETDLAIQYYEESLELCKQHGKASTDLMKLYNKKRQEAAEAKDDEKVKEYMDKVQNLMQMSKDMIRGNA